MALFEKEIDYWNSKYKAYSGLDTSEVVAGNILPSMEAIDAVFSGDNVGDNINLAGLYINFLLRPRTSFIALSGITNGDINKADIDTLIATKQITDAVVSLYSGFDADNFISRYLDNKNETSLIDVLQDVETDVIDGMTLDDFKELLGQIADFFDIYNSSLEKSSEDKESTMPYQAAVIFLHEKGFESVAARIENEFQTTTSDQRITVDQTVSHILDSLTELEELGYNRHVFA